MANISTITEDLADLIRRDGNGGKLNLTDYGLKWTWFDDDAENCGTSSVNAINLVTYYDKCELVEVEFDNTESCTIDRLNYEDVFGNNFAQWLYYELV